MPSFALDHLRVLRTGGKSVEIRWGALPASGYPVRVYRGDRPGEIAFDRLLATVSGGGSVALSDLDGSRPHFFGLRTGTGAELIVGERRIPAEGAVNLRDLGGYEAADGRRVRWGRIFRSDNLARLTDAGLALVKRLGIRLVCDFRTQAEAARLPNRFPDGPQVGYLRLSIQHGEFEPTAVFERIKNGDYDWISEEFMLQGYVANIEHHAQVWGSVFAKLSDPASRPLLFHCTGGKDRTGTCAALILLALGVPVETVIEDYGLSDGYIAEVRRTIFDAIESFGVDIGKVAPYFMAPPSRLRALLEYVDSRYGSAVGYLRQKAGVSEKTLDRLKSDLLE
jgi:protein-tyrosine phosphatase